MKAYYTKYEHKGGHKFLYISLNIEDARKICAGLDRYTGDKETHLTTDRNFDQYISKRKEVPVIVQICSTLTELETRLAGAGIYL